jgi:hypothetical protein
LMSCSRLSRDTFVEQHGMVTGSSTSSCKQLRVKGNLLFPQRKLAHYPCVRALERGSDCACLHGKNTDNLSPRQDKDKLLSEGMEKMTMTDLHL